MDYKITHIQGDITEVESPLPEIDGLKFVVLPDGQMAFDATEYCASNSIQEVNSTTFMRAHKHYIEMLIKQIGIDAAKMFYTNKDGHSFIIQQLVFMYVGFVNPEMYLYFNTLLYQILTGGIAVSDGFVYAAAAERLPSSVLETIIKSRTNDTESEQHSDTNSGV